MEGLVVSYRTAAGVVHAVDGAELVVPRGAMLGLVGESGCGKTTLARALMGVLPGNARVVRGAIRLEGEDLVGMAPGRRRGKLWREIAFVPQSAMNSLDPVWRLRAQMHEVLRGRGGFSAREADARAEALFAAVGLPAARLADYPHQFSGGMRQRAAIALALALGPKLVVADEPVTALDVIVQRQVLDTLRRLGEEMHAATVFVTHDIAVVAYLCSIVAVMYAGRIVEYGPASELLVRPSHPYTMGLMNAFPDLVGEAGELAPIEGAPPDLHDPPPGCRFAARCPFVLGVCLGEDPGAAGVASAPLTPALSPREREVSHWAACHRVGEAGVLRGLARKGETWRR